jgi:Esterase/lipase
MTLLNAFTDMYMPSASEETKADEQLSFLIIPDESFDKDLWPPTTFHISGLDTLRDEGLLFAEKLKRVGVETRVKVYEGFPHAFNLFPQLKEAGTWKEAKLEELRWLLSKQGGEVRN